MDEKLIEDFIQGKLTDEQHFEFEKQLKNDPQLAAEVAFQAGVKEGIQETERSKTLEFLKEVEKETPQQVKRNFTYWAAAASIVLVASVYFIIQSMLFNSEELYNEYYYSPKSFVNDQQRGESAGGNAHALAFELYDKQRYKEAIDQFELLLHNVKNDELEFYSAISYLNMDREEEAINLLDQITEDSKYYDDGIWYSALASLKLKKREQASKKLKQLLEIESEYQEEAARLLEDLK